MAEPSNNPDDTMESIFTDSVFQSCTIQQDTSSSTQTAQSAREPSRSDSPRSIPTRIRHPDHISSPFENIIHHYEINRSMAKHLEKLRGYEIVIVCDDSGSMNTPLDGTQQTRWDHLRDIVTMVLKVAVIFDPRGVDIYFLNRDPVRHVKDLAQVQQIFSEPPQGYTPLVPVLAEVFKLPASRRGHDKKLLVFIATDGAPTDGDGNETIDELERLMREKRQEDTTFVQFLICTDDPQYMDYLVGWDRTMKNVDVTRDFKREKAQICQCQGNMHRFSMGDYVVKALVGAIIPEIDNLNENPQ